MMLRESGVDVGKPFTGCVAVSRPRHELKFARGAVGRPHRSNDCADPSESRPLLTCYGNTTLKPATIDVTSWSSVTFVPGTSRIEPEIELRNAYTAARFNQIERVTCTLP